MGKRFRSPLSLGFMTLTLAAYVGVSGYAVLALFTDSETVPANDFTTGTIDLSTTPTTAAITVANMAPGDAIGGPITVSNDGTLDYRYAISSATTEDFLAAQLDLTIRIEATAGDCTATSTGTPILYGPSDLGSTGVDNVVGNPTQGADAGDRTLTAGSNEVLCFQVSLPLSTDNTYQNQSTSATFTFAAEQTANNP